MPRSSATPAAGSGGTVKRPSLSSTPPSRPLFPSISLRGSSHTTRSPDPPQSARSSLINVLTRPRHAVTGISTASTVEGLLTPEDEFSDQSTISSYTSYASSVMSTDGSRQPSSEDVAKVFRTFLETPFVQTKSTIKHSEFGHCNNPNWRWTSQVRCTVEPG
jgi:serine palmitoyltransferase